MSKPKSPFITYTVSEILSYEAVTYVIQVGRGVFDAKGKWVFDKKTAALYYNKILKELRNQLENGNKKQQKDATKALSNLRVMPLRIH